MNQISAQVQNLIRHKISTQVGDEICPNVWVRVLNQTSDQVQRQLHAMREIKE